jgi:hypothetical protein
MAARLELYRSRLPVGIGMVELRAAGNRSGKRNQERSIAG